MFGDPRFSFDRPLFYRIDLESGSPANILNFVLLRTIEGTSSYEGDFAKSGFLSKRLISETKSLTPTPHIFFFFAVLTRVTHYLRVGKVRKNLCCRRFLRERP